MATWYVNQDSLVQDGLTLDTGYHTCDDLFRERLTEIQEFDPLRDKSRLDLDLFLTVNVDNPAWGIFINLRAS